MGSAEIENSFAGIRGFKRVGRYKLDLLFGIQSGEGQLASG